MYVFLIGPYPQHITERSIIALCSVSTIISVFVLYTRPSWGILDIHQAMDWLKIRLHFLTISLSISPARCIILLFWASPNEILSDVPLYSNLFLGVHSTHPASKWKLVIVKMSVLSSKWETSVYLTSFYIVNVDTGCSLILCSLWISRHYGLCCCFISAGCPAARFSKISSSLSFRISYSSSPSLIVADDGRTQWPAASKIWLYIISSLEKISTGILLGYLNRRVLLHNIKEQRWGQWDFKLFCNAKFLLALITPVVMIFLPVFGGFVWSSVDRMNLWFRQKRNSLSCLSTPVSVGASFHILTDPISASVAKLWSHNISAVIRCRSYDQNVNLTVFLHPGGWSINISSNRYTTQWEPAGLYTTALLS